LSQPRHNSAPETGVESDRNSADREMPMTLEQFLNATAGVPEPVLRCAMVAALAAEPARTPEAYHRFYDRVIHELGLDRESSDNGRGRRL
jgi:hypothetical protein